MLGFGCGQLLFELGYGLGYRGRRFRLSFRDVFREDVEHVVAERAIVVSGQSNEFVADNARDSDG